MTLRKALLIPAFTLLAAIMQAQSTYTINGTVTDSMCGKKHMMQGASAEKCTKACIRSGADYALVSGDKVYTLKGDKAQFDKFAGTNVVIEGETSGSTVTVKSIKTAS